MPFPVVPVAIIAFCFFAPTAMIAGLIIKIKCNIKNMGSFNPNNKIDQTQSQIDTLSKSYYWNKYR